MNCFILNLADSLMLKSLTMRDSYISYCFYPILIFYMYGPTPDILFNVSYQFFLAFCFINTVFFYPNFSSSLEIIQNCTFISLATKLTFLL